MYRSKLVYRVFIYLLVSFFLFASIGPVATQANFQQSPADIIVQTQLPPPPDDPGPDDLMLPGRGDDYYPVLPQPASTLAVIGGTWMAQGPGPAYNGQVENLANLEVVGAIHTVAAHPTNANILYAGGVNGGVWKTTDATAVSPNWTPLTDDKSSLSIGALEFDPTDGTNNTLVAGIGRYSAFYRYGGPRTGLLRTIDGGVTWTDINAGGTLTGKNISGVAPRGSTLAISVNTADSFTCANIGLFHSTNTGASFVQVNPPGVAHDLAGDPTNNTTLYAGLTYVPGCSGGTWTNGIYKSTSTGATWTKVSNAAMDILIVDGTTNNIEIAAHGVHVFVNIIQNGQSAGIFYSGNGGTSWTAMDLPLLPAGTLGTIANVLPGMPIVITTSAPHGLSSGDEVQITNVTGTTGANGIHTIAVTGPSTFFLNGSNDPTPYTGGGNWQKLVGMNPKVKPGAQGYIHASIRVDPVTPTTVYVGGDRQDWPFPNYIGAQNYTGSLFRGNALVPAAGTSPSPQWDHLTHFNGVVTIPGGGTLSSSAPHADSREMVFDANGDIIEVDDGGIYRRTNPQSNAGDWIPINGNIQVTEMHDVAYDGLSNIIISGNQDTGTTYQTAAGALLWDSLSTADGGDVAVDNIVLAGSNQSVRYSSYQNLGWFRRSVWNANGTLAGSSYPALTVTGGGAALSPWFYTPIATNAVAASRLLIGASNSLYESTDEGATITEIGPGLVVNSSGNGGHMIAYGGTQSAVNNPDVFYVATGSSVAVRTSSGGVINTYVVSGAGTIRGVVMDPTNWSTAFAIDSDQVFSTINAGLNWTDITGSLAETNLHSIEAAPGMVFVGGGTGVYVMDTSTGIWSQFGSGMSHAPVWDLDYDSTDDVLVAGTLGRGAWLISTKLGDITVEKTPSVNSAAVGQTITYTYNITNTGVVTISSITSVDDMLGAVTLATTTLPPGVGTSGVLTYTVVSGDLPGPIVNTVDVTGAPPTGAAVTASDSASVDLPGSPAITVSKTASMGSASIGQTIAYTYHITNTGDVPLSSIAATDDRLGAVTLGATTLLPGVGTSGTLTYIVVEGDLPGPIVNTVNITGTSHIGTDVTASDNATVSLTSSPAIIVSKTASVNIASVGETIIYTYYITNTGDVSISSITAVDDKLGSVILGTTALSPGASTSGTLTYVIVESDLPGPIVNTVDVIGTPPVGEDVTVQTVEVVDIYQTHDVYLPLINK